MDHWKVRRRHCDTSPLNSSAVPPKNKSSSVKINFHVRSSQAFWVNIQAGEMSPVPFFIIFLPQNPLATYTPLLMNSTLPSVRYQRVPPKPTTTPKEVNAAGNCSHVGSCGAPRRDV